MTRFNFSTLALAGVATIGLTACDNDKADDVAGNEMTMTEPADTGMASDMDDGNVALTPEQQARRDKLDMTTYQKEIDSYYAKAADFPGDRSSWTWKTIDRNGDGKISAAEYAFYRNEFYRNAALPASGPYYETPRITIYADRFYGRDTNGDGYLSQDELDMDMKSNTSTKSRGNVDATSSSTITPETEGGLAVDQNPDL